MPSLSRQLHSPSRSQKLERFCLAAVMSELPSRALFDDLFVDPVTQEFLEYLPVDDFVDEVIRKPH
jgi:hypothetical protein